MTGLALAALCAYHVAAQTILATKETVPESRIIVRYPEGSGEQLQGYTKRLERLRGVRRVEPLYRLDMAIVLCHAGVDEDALLAVIDSDKAVELAVPDSWVHAFDQRTSIRT